MLKQLTNRIAESDRTKLTGSAIADALYGLQGFSSSVPEVKILIEELAKKIAVTAAELTSDQLGRSLFGLQGLSSSSSLFEESIIGIDSDEVQFLLSTLWDKIKIRTGGMTMSAIGQGLQGITMLRDPIANNIRQYMYLQLLRLGIERSESDETVLSVSTVPSKESEENAAINSEDIISVVRALRLNNLLIPKWLATEYIRIEELHAINPIIPMSRADKLVTQRYAFKYSNEKFIVNTLVDGFRLDMFFPDSMINFELDGPAHRYPSRAKYDKERDLYLNKKGYKVS